MPPATRCLALFLTLGLLAAKPHAQQPAPSTPTLHVYGPGGPVEPLRACAVRYTAATGVAVEVTAGPEADWIAHAQLDADIVYGGAEYMLTQFGLAHPGFLLAGSRVELFPREAAILVRPGNPRHIRTLADLAQPGIRLVDVNGAGQEGLWEDLAGRAGLIDALGRNIAVSVPSSAEAIAQWNTHPELDAWITFGSWHNRLPDTTALVRLPPAQRLLRGTPAAIARRSAQPARAQALLDQLRSPACHAIFQQWGWN